MRAIGCIATIFAILLASKVYSQPSELDVCVTARTGMPTCSFGDRLVFDICSSTYVFLGYPGRAAWYPLKNVGFITIEIQTRGGADTIFPLFIEIVPLPDPLPSDFCASGLLPGFVVGWVSGGAQTCGGGWDRFGPLDIDSIVPYGHAYALQLVSFQQVEEFTVYNSPAINCVRVTPVVTGVAPTSWTQVKGLFR